MGFSTRKGCCVMEKIFQRLDLGGLDSITVITKPNSVKHTFDYPDRRYTTLSDQASLVVPEGTDNPVLRGDEFYEDEEGNITVRRICHLEDNDREVVVISQEFNRTDIISYRSSGGYNIDTRFDWEFVSKKNDEEITQYIHHHYVEGTELKLEEDTKVWLGEV
jgi:hypothetical protein